MMEYKEEDYLSLSGIQHFAFCRRQWALIHIEQQWEDNVRTVEGELLHEKAHDGSFEKRGNMIISRSLPVFSKKLGIRGVCDIVEFHEDKKGVSLFGRGGAYRPVPVEYKRGRPKENDADILQLCAQAMCLEEMLLCDISEGYLYYGETKRRLSAAFDQGMRKRVTELFLEMHDLFNKRYTPKVKTSKSCKSCSIADLCLPMLCKNISVKQYINKHILTEDG